MKRLKWFLALAFLITMSDGGTPLVAQEVRYYSWCVHIGDYYYGGQGWHVIRCYNAYTKEEAYYYEPI